MVQTHVEPSALHKQKYAWTVPLALFVGIVLALSLKWPIYLGILIGYLWSAAYTKANNPWGKVFRGTWSGILNMWKVCVVLLLFGLIVALWMVSGTIPFLTDLGSTLIRNSNVIWITFLLSSGLSMLIGSSIATWSILGPPLLALTPSHLIAVVAGALVSGGMVGDRSSPMSTSVIVMSKAAEMSPTQTLHQLLRTAIMPFLLSVLGFFLFNVTVGIGERPTAVHNMQLSLKALLLMVPPLVVILLSILRVTLLYNLSVASVLALIYALVVHKGSLMGLLLEVWYGYPLHLQTHYLHIGGIQPMIPTSLLILTAGAFQGVTAIGGAIESLTQRLFVHTNKPASLVGVAYVLSVSFSMLMGSQMLSILMSGNTLLPQFETRGIGRREVLQIIADSSELISSVIPWNLLGLQASAIIGVATLQFAPYTCFVYFALILSIALTWRRIRGQMAVDSHLPSSFNA